MLCEEDGVMQHRCRPIKGVASGWSGADSAQRRASPAILNLPPEAQLHRVVRWTQARVFYRMRLIGRDGWGVKWGMRSSLA